jgi:pimeloyl-ACP methyl ester carboxylesterase
LRERPKIERAKSKGIAMSNGMVTSTDGTKIAYERHGSGDPVIVVNTVAGDRSGLSGLAGLLAEHFTVYSYDRRGRGDSGDTKPYAPEREVEDLAALVKAAGGGVSLISGSAGCVLCLDAATTLGDSVRGLYLFEPPFIVNDGRPPMPADYAEHLESVVASGDRADLLPQVSVETLPDQDHGTLWMAPEAVVASARRFLTR